MAQYGDPYNPASQPNGSGESGTNASANGASLGSPQGGGSAYQPASPTDRTAASLESRRRNQWRQYKHMTPDFGLPAAAPEPVPAPAPAASPAREAALPSFAVKPVGSSPAPAPAPTDRAGVTQLSSSPQPLQMHPHSSMTTFPARPTVPTTPRSPIGNGGLGRGVPPVGTTVGNPVATPMAATVGANPSGRTPAAPTSAMPPKVTPLRPRSRNRPPAATSAAQALTSPGNLAPAPSREGTALRSRRFSPQRRLAKLPLPALYAIRLAILGIGVAAIAGTLLSILSPSNVASTNGEGNPTTATPATNRNRPAGALVSGKDAVTIADLQPTTELTRLKAQLEQLATLTPGLTPTLFALDLDSGRYVDLEGSKAVAAASTIKVPILIAFLQQVDAGNIALNQAVVLQEQHIAGGSGTMANDAVGSEYTALDVATRMIIHSDNTATNMMIEVLGGPDALNQQFATWGLESTVLRNPLPDLEGTNTTSTRDLAMLMGLIDQGNVLSQRSRDRLLSVMQRTVNRSLIAFSLTDGSIVANKTGDIAMALGDVALVDTPNGNRYVLAMMVQRPNNDGRASELIRRLTETTHTELNQPIAPVGRANPTPDGEATEGTTPGPATPPDGTSPAGSPTPPAGEAPGLEGTPGMDAPGMDTPGMDSGLESAPATPPRQNPSPAGDQVPPG